MHDYRTINSPRNNRSDPIISIITPSYNRAHELDSLVSSMQDQTLSHDLFEMIIADDGSADGTEDLIRTWQKKVDFELRYVSQENQGPGAARNLGMEQARGELFLFIDSDCEAKEDWAQSVYERYVSDGFDACGGPDASKGDFTPLQRAIDFSMTSFFTTGGLRGHSDRRLAKFYPRSHNMGMTRKLYAEVGGFGGLRHGQDIELSHRIIKSGAKVMYIPEAVVYHRRRTSLKRFFRQVFNWGVARINLAKIDSGMLEPLHFLPPAALLLAVIVLVGLLVTPTEFVPVVELGFGLLIALSIYGGIKTSSVRVALMLPIIVPIQVFGYGFGFLVALIWRFGLRREVWMGLTKKYYH